MQSNPKDMNHSRSFLSYSPLFIFFLTLLSSLLSLSSSFISNSSSVLYFPLLSYSLIFLISTPPPISFLILSLFILSPFTLIDPFPPYGSSIPSHWHQLTTFTCVRIFQGRVMHCKIMIVKIKGTHFELYCYLLNCFASHITLVSLG